MVEKEVGETLTLRGFNGDFHLQPNNREAIFIAGGSGCQPFAVSYWMCTHKVTERHVSWAVSRGTCI